MHLSEKTLEIFAQKINSKKCNTSQLSRQLFIQKNNLANMWTIYQRKFLTICVIMQGASQEYLIKTPINLKFTSFVAIS